MQNLFEINGIDIHLTAQASDSIEHTGFLALEGAVTTNNIQSFEAALKKMKTFDYLFTVIDFSKSSSFCDEAWAILKEYNNSRPDGNIYLLRMPPTLFERFHSLDYDKEFKHFRTFGDLDRFMIDKIKNVSETSAQEAAVPEETAPEELPEEALSTPFAHEEVEEVISDESSADRDEDTPEGPPPSLSRPRFPLNESREIFEESETVEISDEEIEETLPTQSFDDETIPEKMIAIRGKLRSLFENKIYEWKSLGYDTSYLDSYLDKNLDDAKKAFALYSKNLSDCREMEAAIEMIENPLLKKDRHQVLILLKSPMEIDKAREAFSSLLTKAEQLDHDAFLPLADYQFDNFVKGNNKDTVDMVSHLVHHLESYDRPLLIQGTNGTGKTHILNAIGNTIRLKTAKTVNYIPANTFIVELENMREEGRLHVFRKRYMSCDILLFDDIHLLEDASPASHEFRFLMDSLSRQSKLLIMASVLKSDEFRFISKDLLSRLKSAVHLTMSPPDEVTLTHILEKRMAALHMESERGVARYLAQMAPGDIRKAFGLLETLHLYSKTYHEIVSFELVRELTSSNLSYEEIRQMTPPSPAGNNIATEEEYESLPDEDDFTETPLTETTDDKPAFEKDLAPAQGTPEPMDFRIDDDLPDYSDETSPAEESAFDQVADTEPDNEEKKAESGEEDSFDTSSDIEDELSGDISDISEESISDEDYFEEEQEANEEITEEGEEPAPADEDDADPFAGLDDTETEDEADFSDVVTDDSDLDLWEETDNDEDDPFAL